MLEFALKHHREGRLADAETIYNDILREDPKNPDALHFLGLLAHQVGRHEDAVDLIERAHRVARPQPFSLNNLGMAYGALGRHQDAKRCFSRALAIKPDYAEAHNNLGATLRNLAQPKEAERAYRRAIALKPEAPDAHYNLGNVLMDLGKPAEAEQSFRRALALKPSYVEALNNLGAALVRLGRHEDAERSFRAALSLEPRYIEAYHNLGNLLKDRGRLEDAVQVYSDGTAQQPDSVETKINLANVLQHLGRLEEAEQAHREIVKLAPGLPWSHYNLGCCLLKMDRTEEGLASLSRAASLKPDDASARWMLTMAQLPAIYDQEEDLARRRAAFSHELDKLDTFLRANPPADPAGVLLQTPFYLAYQEENNRPLLAKYGELCTALMQPRRGKTGVRPSRSARGERLRLGIVSAHIKAHAVWEALIKGWVRQLDPNRFDIRLFCLNLYSDHETELARSLVSHFEQAPHNLAGWMGSILEHELDVLAYPEVGMDPLTTQLASLRLAPVQFASWGHPETTGLPSIDYFVSAEGLEPRDAAANYTEQLIALPNLGCFYRPDSVNASPPDLGALGVRGDAPLLLCCGTPFKYLPQYDRTITRIARALGSCQFVFFHYTNPLLSEKLKSRLGRAFERAGLDFARHVVFVPWQSRPHFHGLMRRADVFLDTVGFSGFNTAMQAVECGLPVVASEGKFMRGRLASGILKRMGLPDLVAASEDEYVVLAAKLAGNAGYRHEVRTRMEASRASLYEDRAPIKALEDFLVQVTNR